MDTFTIQNSRHQQHQQQQQPDRKNHHEQRTKSHTHSKNPRRLVEWTIKWPLKRVCVLNLRQQFSLSDKWFFFHPFAGLVGLAIWIFCHIRMAIFPFAFVVACIRESVCVCAMHISSNAPNSCWPSYFSVNNAMFSTVLYTLNTHIFE